MLELAGAGLSLAQGWGRLAIRALVAQRDAVTSLALARCTNSPPLLISRNELKL
jgi:hypothetical protein